LFLEDLWWLKLRIHSATAGLTREWLNNNIQHADWVEIRANADKRLCHFVILVATWQEHLPNLRRTS